VIRKRWPGGLNTAGDLLGRVWTDLEELKPWVVLLRRPAEFAERQAGPTLVFRAADEEFQLPVNRDTHLEDLDDRVLRGYLRLARGQVSPA
jgi:hypothetical protein